MRTVAECRKAKRVTSLRLTGCEILGRGYFATVLACGPDEVVKVCVADYRRNKNIQDAWPIWARFCMLHPDLPGVLAIRSMEVDRGLCTSYMERCEPLNRFDRREIDFISCVKRPYDLGKRHDSFKETGDALAAWLATEYPGIRFTIDAHRKNIMRSKDGRFVLTDPLIFGPGTAESKVTTSMQSLTTA